MVEVGFVPDVGQAKVLSWAAGKLMMKAMIAPDADRYKRLLRSGQSAFNADTMQPFTLRDAAGPRGRNEEEKKQGRLPLKLPVPAEAGSEWPKHAVNMIDLPADLVRQSVLLFAATSLHEVLPSSCHGDA